MKRSNIRKLLKSNKGFSIIELMVVVVIIGILATTILPKIIGKSDEARVAKVKADIKSLETALDMYKLDNGMYPDTEQGLNALVQLPETGVLPKKWNKSGYLTKPVIPNDAWDNKYIYISPGTKGDYDLMSYGADKMQGGEDFNKDITNWDVE
ncbi:MAG: type II secretion system major pseudopilin GspG [Desulfobacterales bacterium]|nr:type II secretion system major pseudopilin GspG [Desulfobacterales bacterium]